ncbi:MAG: hypothetical protein VW602_09395, partial [Paracoccaceae bacterium]
PALNDKGIYVVEDTHTSYWPGFEGGYKNPNSFVEFAKDLIDKMHSWYREDDPNFPFDPLAREIGSISFYDSMIVIKKDIKDPPVSIVSQDGKLDKEQMVLLRSSPVAPSTRRKHASIGGCASYGV